MGWGWELSGKKNEEPIWKCCILTLGGGYQGIHDYWNLSKWVHFTVCQLYFSKKKKSIEQERSWVKDSMVSWRCCLEQLQREDGGRSADVMGAVRECSQWCPHVSVQLEERPLVKGTKSEGWGLRSIDKAQNRMLQLERGFSWDEWTHFESYASWLADGDHWPGWGLAGHGEWKRTVLPKSTLQMGHG